MKCSDTAVEQNTSLQADAETTEISTSMWKSTYPMTDEMQRTPYNFKHTLRGMKA